MKKIIPFLILAFLLISNNLILSSQDIITLRTGDEIKAVVNEVNAETVKYKKFENPTGPVYTIEKTGVFMIKYEDGTKEVFETSDAAVTSKGNVVIPSEKGKLTYKKYGAVLENGEYLTPDEVLAKYSKNPEALKAYNKGKKLIKTGSFLGGAGLVVSLGVGLLIKDPSMPVLATTLIFSSGALIGSIATTVSGRKKIRKSVEYYNSGFEVQP